MENFVLHKVLTLAVLSEVVTNLVKTVVPNIDKTYITAIAGLIGIILAWLTGVGIFTTLEIPVKYLVVDYILTGIIVSRGANLVHDIAKRLNI